MPVITWQIVSVNQRLVKSQPAPGQPAVYSTIWEVQAVVVPDSLPMTQQQSISGQHISRWPVAPPFQAGDLVMSPWPAKQSA